MSYNKFNRFISDICHKNLFIVKKLIDCVFKYTLCIQNDVRQNFYKNDIKYIINPTIDVNNCYITYNLTKDVKTYYNIKNNSVVINNIDTRLEEKYERCIRIAYHSQALNTFFL